MQTFHSQRIVGLHLCRVVLLCILGTSCQNHDYSSLASSPVQRLSEAGLYQDIATKNIADDIHYFVPKFELWSDGADKKRWIALPEGKIVSSDSDFWGFPVGTKVWKEFSLMGRRIETRMLEKYDEGFGVEAWGVSVFLWRADESEADRISHGRANVAATPFGTEYDIPSVDDCTVCHQSGDMVLGFSAPQLAGPGAGLRLADLVRMDKLSVVPVAEPTLPTDPKLALAAGLLHANCSSCHNPLSQFPGSRTSLNLLLPAVAQAPLPLTRSAVDQLTSIYQVPGRRLAIDSLLVESGSVRHSAVAILAAHRGVGQMPPLATEAPNAELDAALAAWIDDL